MNQNFVGPQSHRHSFCTINVEKCLSKQNVFLDLLDNVPFKASVCCLVEKSAIAFFHAVTTHCLRDLGGSCFVPQ